MKKITAVLLVFCLLVTLGGCSGKSEPAPEPAERNEVSFSVARKPESVYQVAYVTCGASNASAEAGLTALADAGRIVFSTIPAEAGQEAEALEAVSDGTYDVIICGNAQMTPALETVAGSHPEEKYIIIASDSCRLPNVLNLTFPGNDMGYLAGVLAGSITESGVLGFLSEADSTDAEDALVGFIEGALSVNGAVRVSVAFGTPDQLAPGCGPVYDLTGTMTGPDVIGVDTDGCAVTRNVGSALIWCFDEMDAGHAYYGTVLSMGLAEGCIGLQAEHASDEALAAVTAAKQAVAAGTVIVDTVIGENAVDLVALRESVSP